LQKATSLFIGQLRDPLPIGRNDKFEDTVHAANRAEYFKSEMFFNPDCPKFLETHLNLFKTM